ncbi:hypothetical protein C922_03754 [Plasmodium inui San Antonio 1]|uniref:Uncharacterized protein n=1 Tax=Plasmodium inui San Antonio 1 TaxID=1237626 RepID=W7AKB9_9APIC|nr:hypothetical protein C922_03754 [Plasmodium inui San Antonio 1]EUD65771.1 hypothetical protein C922_03754 [Plasmodium inui San Antonio 1]
MKRKRNYNEGNNLNAPPKKHKKASHSKIKYDISAEQEKDNRLLSYLSKKLKISNKDDGKSNEEKIFKQLEKDGFDSNLLKLTDLIFGEFQKSYKKKCKNGNNALRGGDDTPGRSSEEEGVLSEGQDNAPSEKDTEKKEKQKKRQNENQKDRRSKKRSHTGLTQSEGKKATKAEEKKKKKAPNYPEEAKDREISRDFSEQNVRV